MTGTLLPPWIERQLQTLLAQRGHAWLLQGPSGLGQYRLALEMVRAWLCEQAPADERAPQRPACGQCAGCHAIDVRTHADLCVLMPESDMLALQWPLGERAQGEIDSKKRKPSREVRVDAMRDAVEFTQRTSARGRGKAVLVYPAERMNAITANALLKTLEEPPGQTRFVLASHAAHRLLPTIRSRCQTHTMLWPQQDEVLQWLQQQDMPAGDAQTLLRASGGRPEDALALVRSGIHAAQWAQLPAAMRRGDAASVSQWPPADVITMLQKLCHDLLATSAGASPRFFAAGDLFAAPPLPALTRWAGELAIAARSAEHPWNAGLMIEALVSQAQGVLAAGQRR